MMQMNKFEELLKCKICDNIFKKPILLPCYETICHKDLIYIDGKATIECLLCKKEHIERDTGFHFLKFFHINNISAIGRCLLFVLNSVMHK